MLKVKKSGLRKKVFISVVACILGPYLLVAVLTSMYFQHRSSILLQDYFHHQPANVLFAEKETIDNLKTKLSLKPLFNTVANCSSSEDCNNKLGLAIAQDQRLSSVLSIFENESYLFEADLKGNPNWLLTGQTEKTSVIQNWATKNWSNLEKPLSKTFYFENGKSYFLIKFLPIRLNKFEKKYRVFILSFDLLKSLRTTVLKPNLLLLRYANVEGRNFRTDMKSWELLDQNFETLEKVHPNLIYGVIQNHLQNERQLMLKSQNKDKKIHYSWAYRSNIIPNAYYFSIESESLIRRPLKSFILLVTTVLTLLLAYLITVAYYFVSRVTQPVISLSLAVDKYSNNLKNLEKDLLPEVETSGYIEVEILKRQFGNTIERLNKQFHLMERLIQTWDLIAKYPSKKSFNEYMNSLYLDEFNINFKDFDAIQNRIQFESGLVNLSADENMWDSVFKHKSFEFDGEMQAQVFHEQVQYFYKSRELELEFRRNISQRREFEIAESIITPLQDIHLSDQIRWSHCYLPARYLGGDFIEAFEGEKALDMMIGDVSGKGLGSALVSARMKVGFQVLSSSNNTLEQNITHLNTLLCMGATPGVFCTMFIARYYPLKHQLDFVSGGHNKMLLISPEGEKTWLSAEGLPLGIFEDIEYRCNTCSVKTGSLLLLYTDGCTEAHNTKFELYGENRLIEYLDKSHKKDVKTIKDGLVKELQDFSVGQEQSDDITFLMVRLT